MKEHVRNNYFLVLKLLIVLVLEIYIITDSNVLSGASGQVLLLSAFFIALITGCEFVHGRKKLLFAILEGISLVLLIVFCEQGFALLLVILILDFVSVKGMEIGWYLLGYVTVIFTEHSNIENQLLIITFLIIIYFQHGVIIHSYQRQLKEDELAELKLKRSINQNEILFREEISKSLLSAENSILEEKSRLSQALHDKLGHSINGSVYQLEACKVLMKKDRKTSEAMIQAVIDNLRKSMDEIRELLRKERPDKHKLSLLQLHRLCDDCKKLGIETTLYTQGNLASIPDNYMEIILDNSFEAVSNALKYAKCTRIEIKLIIMNQLIRCTIADNGVGCDKIKDGMGLSGMRKRVRNVNGILDFETEIGFTINMLLPLE